MVLFIINQLLLVMSDVTDIVITTNNAISCDYNIIKSFYDTHK